MFRSLFVFSLLLLIPWSGAAQQAPLTLAEAYAMARERNPMVQAGRAAADAMATREGSAMLPPDPQVQLGIMNASLPGLRTDMPGAMAPSVQAMQMIPFPGKLALEGGIARQSTAMARSQAEEAWWEVRTRTAMAFYEIYRTDRQIAVMQETLGLLRQFEHIATTMYSVGEGRQSDVLRAGVEVARMQADLARMSAMRTAAAARLNALLDRSADATVLSVALSPLPAELPSADLMREWAEQTRPMLERGRTGVEQAGSRQALARRELWPDLTVGVQYGQRPSDMGVERMGSLMLGFSVPVYASQRQIQMRREAAAMEQMARAELSAARADVAADAASLLADLARAGTLIGLYRTAVLPQAEATVASALASYRVGRVDFMTLLDAQMTTNQFRQELYTVVAEYGVLIAELEMNIGRELPPSAISIGEES
jgi:outer membrane protein, heavy metal efflux system